MSTPELQSQLLNCFGQLAAGDQVRVVNFAMSLSDQEQAAKPGLTGKELLALIDTMGTISLDDLALMKQAIQEGFEQVDENEW